MTTNNNSNNNNNTSKNCSNNSNKNNDDDKYKSFWTEFGVAFKEGLYSDHENRDALLELLMCQSSADSEELTSLQAYVDRMTDEQESIYYLTGESRQAVENSPPVWVISPVLSFPLCVTLAVRLRPELLPCVTVAELSSPL